VKATRQRPKAKPRSNRTWFLCICEDKVMITIDRDGKPEMGEWYR
jgi:hypothetical protein